ncbi:MAG: nucleotidyltransferase family protein [Wohlfahrtiimonas sp.]
MTTGLLLMTAGHSQRFKDASGGIHKLLYPCDANNMAMLNMTYQKARSIFLPEQICIVTNQAEPQVHALASQLGSPTLQIQSDGLGESIAQAVHVNQSWDALLILHGDLPFIQSSTIQEVYNALQHHMIARPIYHGQFGHPVGFQKSLYPQLMALQGDQGASAILKTYPVTYLLITDQGTIHDIDRPQDLMSRLP